MENKTIEELQQKRTVLGAEMPSQRDQLAKQLAAVKNQLAARMQKSTPAKGMIPKRGMTIKPFRAGGRGKKG